MSRSDEMRQSVLAYSDAHDTDLVTYFGDVTRGGFEEFSDLFRKRPLRKHVILMLMTYGGDANAAYRIARCMQQRYHTIAEKDDGLPRPGAAANNAKGTFSVCIDGICKSAGTIICLGADKLIMSDNAELGPIDAQLRKQDEVGERTSGLTPIQAIQFLESQSVRLFKRHFQALRNSQDLGFSTKMAAGIATEMTVGLLTSIYQQIDPIRLAEVDRSLKIAGDYGERLAHGNLKDEAIEKLLAKYPSHGFVIDRREAGELFTNVTYPESEIADIAAYFKGIGEYVLARDETFVVFLSPERKAPDPVASEAPQEPAAEQGGTQ